MLSSLWSFLRIPSVGDGFPRVDSSQWAISYRFLFTFMQVGLPLGGGLMQALTAGALLGALPPGLVQAPSAGGAGLLNTLASQIPFAVSNGNVYLGEQRGGNGPCPCVRVVGRTAHTYLKENLGASR